MNLLAVAVAALAALLDENPTAKAYAVDEFRVFPCSYGPGVVIGANVILTASVDSWTL